MTAPAPNPKWCLCEDPSCEGWAAYTAHFRDVYDRDPVGDDVALDAFLQVTFPEIRADLDVVKADLYRRMRESGGAP